MKSKIFTIVIIFLISSVFPSSLPDFSLKRIDGTQFSVSDVLGEKIIVIDFWATWCKPCKKLLKKLDELGREFNNEIIILAISTDESSSYARIESFIKSRGYHFNVLLDPDSSVSGIFNPAGTIPYTMIVDLNKKIVFTHTGYVPGFEKKIREKIIELTKK
ncbi:MAG: TlpA family protein disulfide reductase [Candidatus Aminicenantes bacterium]|nr:TlpA family protein disulfide reductase [Candidatus Aminicenantes bacterium]